MKFETKKRYEPNRRFEKVEKVEECAHNVSTQETREEEAFEEAFEDEQGTYDPSADWQRFKREIRFDDSSWTVYYDPDMYRISSKIDNRNRYKFIVEEKKLNLIEIYYASYTDSPKTRHHWVKIREFDNIEEAIEYAEECWGSIERDGEVIG